MIVLQVCSYFVLKVKLTSAVCRQVTIVPCALSSETPWLLSQSPWIATEVFSSIQLRVEFGIEE